MISSIYLNGDGFRENLPPEKWTGLLKEEKGVLWLDLEKPSAEELKRLDETFHFHPLSMDDLRRKIALPKVDEFENYIFVVFHRVYYDEKKNSVKLHELDAFVGKNFLVTVHANQSTSTAYARDRCKTDAKFRQEPPDVIFYAVLSRSTERYFPLLDSWDEKIDLLEDQVLLGHTQGAIHQILDWKNAILNLRKSMGPQRDMLGRLSRRDTPFVTQKGSLYFRDLYDELVRIHTLLEGQRDTIQGVFDAYLSVVSNKMNEAQLHMNRVIQKLTVVSTIFLPLTFIVGVYGMNFDYIPELRWGFGYFAVWGLIVLLVAGMLLYFRKNKWI